MPRSDVAAVFTNSVRRYRTLIRAVLSVALLALLMWRLDIEAAAAALRDADYVYIAPALALFALGKLLVAERWRQMMLSFARIPLAPLFGILLVANLANNILPARLGDLIRVQVPAQRYGTSRARLVATVFATESLLDGIAFAGLGLIGLALIDIEQFPTEIFWGVLGLLIGALIAIVPLAHLRLDEGWQCRGLWARLPDRAQRAIETSVPHFIDGLAIFKDARRGLSAIALSFAIWLLEVGMFALFGLAFGIHLSMPAWMLIMVSANLISAVPITPSNIGAYEVALTELLKALGVAAGLAGAFAIAAHVFNIAAVTVLGLGAMWALRLTFNDVFGFGRDTAESEVAAQEAAARPEPQV